MGLPEPAVACLTGKWSGGSDRMTRLGSRDGSGGSPRALCKEAGPCGDPSPGGPGCLEPWSCALVLAQVQAECRAPREEEDRGRLRRRSRRPWATLPSCFRDGEIKVEGVGLVTGLENTGADPPPSWYRSQLVDEMSKAGVEHASKLLANPQFSMVHRPDDDPDRGQSPRTGSTSRSRCRRPAAPRAWPAAT